MKILKFKKQSKDKYKLYLDNNSDITLYEDVIIKNNLLITKEISDELLEALKKQNNDMYAYTLALGYISVKMRSIKEINDYLKNEDVILSLNTKEYERIFDLPIIQLDFVIRNGHTFKRNAVYLKKARGMMLNYLIEHHIEDIEQIKEIVIDDYHFSEDDSNDDHWVFIKNEKMKYIKK